MAIDEERLLVRGYLLAPEARGCGGRHPKGLVDAGPKIAAACQLGPDPYLVGTCERRPDFAGQPHVASPVPRQVEERSRHGRRHRVHPGRHEDQCLLPDDTVAGLGGLARELLGDEGEEVGDGVRVQG